MKVNNEQFLYWISEEQEVIYPGCKEEDYGLSLVLDENKKLVGLFSYSHLSKELNEIRLEEVHALELEFLIAETFEGCHYTKECLDYQLSNQRISKEYYQDKIKELN